MQNPSQIKSLYQGPNTGTTAAPTYTYPLFDTFWNNEGLRATLFGAKPTNDSPEKFKEDSKIEFIRLVSDSTFSNSLYSFINIK
jgi:hypothetical protein